MTLISVKAFPSQKKTGKKKDQPITKDINALYDAYYAWESLRDFREEAKRNAMYTFGNQWGDYVVVNGKKIKEEDYIKSQGKVPLKNNRVRSLVRNVLGQFSNNQTEPVCVARDGTNRIGNDVGYSSIRIPKEPFVGT